MTDNNSTTQKTITLLLPVLRDFINSRPGFELANYGYDGYKYYQQDYRKCLTAKNAALAMLNVVERYNDLGRITCNNLEKAFESYSGRLSYHQEGDKITLDYTVGQYYPTEYRQAAATVLSSLLWYTWRDDNQKPREVARRYFSRSIANKYFY